MTKFKAAILAILILGAILRLAYLGKVPTLFDGDETYLGYYALSLNLRGSDEFGHKLPLYFSSIGDFKYPLYSYLSTVPVKIFSLTKFSTRATSAVAGILSLAVLLWLVSQLNTRLGLTATLLMAINPWHILMSRKALEANLGLLMVLLVVCSWINWQRKGRMKWSILVILFSALGFFAYPATRIFLILIFAWLTGVSALGKKWLGLILALVMVLVGLVTFISPQSRARGRDITLTSQTNLNTNLQEETLEIHSAGLAHVPAPVARLYSNKYLFLARDITFKFVDHFNPAFYFTRGDDRTRFTLQQSGYLTFVEGLLILVGIFHLSQLPRRVSWPLLAWIVAAAIPSSITTENPHPVRFLLVIPALIFLAAYGIKHFQHKYWLVLAALFALNLGYIGYQGVIQNGFNQPWDYETTLSHLPQVVSRHQADYQTILVPGDPYVFWLFDRKIDPEYFLNHAHLQPDQTAWDRVDSFENIIFKAPGICPNVGKAGALYICPGYVVPVNAKIINYARYADGVPAYSLIEFLPAKSLPSLELPSGFIRNPDVDHIFGPDGIIPQNYPTYWF